MKTRDIILRLKDMGYQGFPIGNRVMVNMISKVPKKKDLPRYLGVWHSILCKLRIEGSGIAIDVNRQGHPGFVTFDRLQWESDGLKKSKWVARD